MRSLTLRIVCALFAVVAIAGWSRASALDYDAAFGPGADAKIAQVMLEGLLDESARIIKDAYGIDGRSGNRLAVMWDDDPLSMESLGSNAAAAASSNIGIPRDTQIFLSRAYFDGQTDAGRLGELRLTVLHELVHAMQFTSDPGLMGGALAGTAPRNDGSDPLAQFLIEGMAEYAGAGNRRTLAYARKRRSRDGSLTDEQIASDIINSITRTITSSQGYANADEMEMYYITSYLATRWYDSQSKKNGGTGVKGLIGYLERHVGSAQGSAVTGVFNEAIKHGSNGHFGEHADLYNSMLDARTRNTLPFCGFVLGVVGEDDNFDAGRVGGRYAEGGPAKTLAQLLQELSGKTPAQGPLSAFGFDEVTIFGKRFGSGAPTPPSDGGGSSAQPPAAGTTVHTGRHDGDVQGVVPDASGRRTIMFTPTATAKTLTLKIDVDLSKFVGIAVDGRALVRGQDYTATSGSTVIEFAEAYLASLTSDTPHAVSIKFNDGGTVGTAELDIVKSSGPAPAPPAASGGEGGGGGGCSSLAWGAALALIFVLRLPASRYFFDR